MDEHNHEMLDEYDNVNGIHDEWKVIILDVMDKGREQAKHIHVYITQNHKTLLPDYDLPSLTHLVMPGALKTAWLCNW